MTALDYGDRRVLWVIDYPRSGATWAARLIGYTLDCPVLSLSPKHDYLEDPVITGRDSDGEWVVRRAHWNTPTHIPGGLEYDDSRDKILHIVRDPRGVAVSSYHYFTFIKDKPGELARCVRQICGLDPGPPLVWHGLCRLGWPGFVEEWLDFEESMKNGKATHIRHLTYTDLHVHGALSLQSILSQLRIKYKPKRTFEAIEVYRIDRAPKDSITRKGILGSWHEELPYDLECMILKYCGGVMRRTGLL